MSNFSHLSGSLRTRSVRSLDLAVSASVSRSPSAGGRARQTARDNDHQPPGTANVTRSKLKIVPSGNKINNRPCGETSRRHADPADRPASQDHRICPSVRRCVAAGTLLWPWWTARSQAPPLACLRGLQRASRHGAAQLASGSARLDRYLFAGCGLDLSAVCLG